MIPIENNEIKDKQIINLEPLDIINDIIPKDTKKIKIIKKSNTQNNINNGTVNNNTINNNTINNNTVNNTNNNTINNTNIVLVNPFGLESLTHTTPELYKKILKGGQTNIVRFLLEAIYSKQENQNFFKDNKNQPHVAYIDDNYTIKYIHESQLRDLILKNIPSKIEQLIYIHKDNMTQEDIINYLAHSINIEKNFIDLDNKSNPNYKNLIDVSNTVNTVIRTHGVKDNILKSQDLFTSNKNDVTKIIEDNKKIKTESHSEFNHKSKTTIKKIKELEIDVQDKNKNKNNDDDIDEEEILALTGYDLNENRKKKKNTKVSSKDKKEEVTKSLYDLKNNLSIQYDKSFSCGINSL
jgi:hypothetical protein